MMRHSTRVAKSAMVMAIGGGMLWGCRQARSSSAAKSSEIRGKNQANAADTVIVPRTNEDDSGASGANLDAVSHLADALKAAGMSGVHTIGLLDGEVHADGCEGAPLHARYTGADAAQYHSPAVEAIARVLRARGYAVTLLSGVKLNREDVADQQRLAATKGSYSLEYSGGGGPRWFATSAERRVCLGTDEMAAFGTGTSWKLPHPALARRLSALGQDAVLVVMKLSGEATGASMNLLGGGTVVPRSRVEMEATLALRSGSVAWTGEEWAEGTLRPPSEQAALRKLNTAVEEALGKAKDAPERNVAANFDAIAAGDLERAPAGSTLGPSVWATMMAAVERTITRSGLGKPLP